MIRFIEDKNEKRDISRRITESLTEWFEADESLEGHIRDSAVLPFWAAFEGDRPVGFICLKETGKDTMELAATGVVKECQGKGVGRRMFAAAKDYASRMGYSFIRAKTGESGVCEFLRKIGFKEFEVLEDCRVYCMSLKSAVNVISTRHSYRGAFCQEAVPEEDLRIIARAGIEAPSGCNKQTTDVVIVNDPGILQAIKNELDPPVARTAPAMIVVLTRRINAYRDRCFAIQDYSAAIENMLLAIVELGYQSCWYEGHITDEDRICDRIAAILNVPDEYDVVCILPVGKALDDFHAPSKKSFDERVRFNGFRRFI